MAARDRIAKVFLTKEDDELYTALLEVIREFMDSDYGKFGYLNEKGAMVFASITEEVWDICGVKDKKLELPPEAWSGAWGRALLKKKPGYSNESFQVPEGHVPIHNHMIVPIVHQGALIGSVQVANKKGSYDDSDLEFLKEMAEYIAPILVARISRAREENQRKAAEKDLLKRTEQLESVNNELTHFAYVASHDLREPLRKISNFTELLAKRYQGRLDEKADKYIDYIVDGASRMQRLIDDLLSFSRISGAQVELSPVNLESLLEITIRDLGSMIDESSAEITHDPLPIVAGNSSQMGSVLQNLLSNAVKFRSNDRVKIHVSSQRREKDWVISVKDNGIGLEMEQAQRIFGIFQRLHARDQYPGTGIGLAVSKKIVERHGGDIWVESAPGEGSTFYFSLPEINGPES